MHVIRLLKKILRLVVYIARRFDNTNTHIEDLDQYWCNRTYKGNRNIQNR